MAYYKTVIKAGATKEVLKKRSQRVGAKERGMKEAPTQEEIQKINQLNAERILRIKINANFGEGDPYITVTYKKGMRPLPGEAKKHIKKLIDKLRKIYRKQFGVELKYIQVTEYKKKAIHHHLLINDVEGQNIAKLVCKLWIYGRPEFKPLDDTGQYKDLAAYLIKETAETYKDNDGGHKQRYSCSRNLIMPKPETKIVKANRWLADPKPEKGYYIDQDTVHNGIDRFTGLEYQRYTMVRINGCSTNNYWSRDVFKGGENE